MKTLLLSLSLAIGCQAAPPDSFFRALHIVESGGKRGGLILGDNGASRGPLQIQRACWQDSRVAGRYEQVDDLEYSKRVASAYLQRYAKDAWQRGDAYTLARVWNGGPRGATKIATKRYAEAVLRNMK